MVCCAPKSSVLYVMLTWATSSRMVRRRPDCAIALIRLRCASNLSPNNMKILFDLFPLILFFISYKFAGSHQEAAHAMLNGHLSGLVSGGAIPASQAAIVVATIVGILATAAQVLYLLIRRKKVDGAL